MVIDLLILNLIVFIYFRRKGMSAEKSLKKGFKAMIIATPIKFALIFLLVPQYLPIYPEKRKLSETEVNMIGTAIWGYTIFYPVWGSYYYGMSTYRSKYRPDFYVDERVTKYGELCEDSKWSDFESCHKYIQNLGELKKYESRFLISAKRLLTSFPKKACDSISAVASGINSYSRLRLDRTENLTGIGREKVYNRYLTNIYFSNFDELFAPYESTCIKVADYKFRMHYLRRKSAYYDENMNNYLLYICEKYNDYCSLYWHKYYSIPFVNKDKVLDDLHFEICNKWPSLRMCVLPRNLSKSDYRKVIKKIRETGDSTEKTSFRYLGSDKAY